MLDQLQSLIINIMAQQLKRWESPRSQGRNAKGRGGAARMRQRRKQQQVLRQQLKAQTESQPNTVSEKSISHSQVNKAKKIKRKGRIQSFPFAFVNGHFYLLIRLQVRTDSGAIVAGGGMLLPVS